MPAYFKLHTEKIGHVKLVKKSEDGVVANLKFKISGNGIDRTYTTNEKGEILIENLVAGFRHISLCLDMLDKIALCIVNIILRTV